MSVADHEARASESEQRPQKQKGVVALGEEPGKQDNREAQKQKRENRPAAELVGPDAERDADGGREKGLHRSEDEHLGGAETVPLDQKGGERGKHSPNRKTERKRQERYPQNPGVARRIGHHINLDNWIFHGCSYKRFFYLLGILIAGSPRLRQRINSTRIAPAMRPYSSTSCASSASFNSSKKTGRPRCPLRSVALNTVSAPPLPQETAPASATSFHQ